MWLRLCRRMLAHFTTMHGYCPPTFTGCMEKSMPRTAPPILLIAKLKPCNARIRILRSQDRLHRRKQDGPSRRNGGKSALESN